MKSSEEMVKSLFDRRAEYEAQGNQKKAAVSAFIRSKAFVISVLCVLFAAIAGGITSYISVANAKRTQPTEFKSSVTGAVYSLSKNLPDGYSLFIPAYDYNKPEERENWYPEEIMIKRGEEAVLRVQFMSKVFYDFEAPVIKSESEHPTYDFQRIKLLEEVNGMDMDYLFYFCQWQETADPETRFNDYYCYIGRFNQSLDSAFRIDVNNATKEEAQTLFEALKLSFIKD